MKLSNIILFIVIFSVVAGIFIMARNLLWEHKEPSAVYVAPLPSYVPPKKQDPVMCVTTPYQAVGYIVEAIGKDRVSILCDDTSLPEVVIKEENLKETLLSKRKEDDAITDKLQTTLKGDAGFFWFSVDDIKSITPFLIEQMVAVDREGANFYVDNAYLFEYQLDTLLQEIKKDLKKIVFRSNERWAPFIYELRGYISWERDTSLGDDVVEINGKETILDPLGIKGDYSGYVDFLQSHMAHLREVGIE